MKVAVPVTTVPSGFEAMAVMAVTPVFTAVARPVEALIVAVEALLELHAAAGIVTPLMVADLFVRFTVVPDAVVPIAMN